MDSFLNKEDGVRDLSLRYESSLILRDEIVYVRLEASGQHFCDELV